jgi:hypothetical protein
MIKIKPFAIAAVFIGIISISSCKKDLELQKTLPNANVSPTHFKEIKVVPTFNWKSTKVISLNVMAANTPIEITNTLVVKTETGDVVFSKLQKMNEAYIGNITLPLKAEKVIISYGTIVKTIAINNGNVVMNYLN